MADKVVKEILSRLELQGDQDRQTSQELRLDMYLDDYKNKINQLLLTQFHRDNYDRLYKLIATYYNLFKKVVNLKSILYKKEAVRVWSKRDKTVDENYNDLLKTSNINTVMPTCNKLTNVNNTSFVRIIPDMEKKIIQYEAIPSEAISIIQNTENTNEINELLHRVTIKDSNSSIGNFIGGTASTNDRFIVKYFYWSKERYIVADAHKEIEIDSDNPYKDNDGNGIIPYILFSNMGCISGNIWNETVNQDLYDGTLQVNVFQTYFNNLIKIAGYRQTWLTGVSQKELVSLNEKVSDPLQPIVLSDPESTIGTFELQSRITDVQDAVHDIISEITDNHGVEFSSRVSSAQEMSGLSLKLSQDAMDNIREEQQPLYRKSENELAEKTVIVSNKDLKSKIDIEGKFGINFHEDKKEIEVKDRILWNNYLIKNNLKSIVDLYKEIDPDVTNEEEALKRIAQNKEENDLLLDPIDFMPEDDTEEDVNEES